MCFCRAHYLMLAVVVLLGLASLLNGCGARGDLYLPKPEQTQAQKPTQPQTTAPTPNEQPAPTQPQSR